jgi:hypothetical protein
MKMNHMIKIKKFNSFILKKEYLEDMTIKHKKTPLITMKEIEKEIKNLNKKVLLEYYVTQNSIKNGQSKKYFQFYFVRVTVFYFKACDTLQHMATIKFLK